MIVVTVGALAGFVQRRTALAAELGYGCALRDLGLRVLRLCCLRPKLLAQVAHVGGHENAVLLFVSVLAAELIVNGDYVFSSKTAIINSSYTSRIIMGPRIMVRMP